MQINLFYNGLPGDGFGWGICNRYLIQELSKLCDVKTPATFKDHKFAGEIHLKEHVLFTPLLDHDFNAPTLPHIPQGSGVVRGRRNFSYTFFESELGPNAAANAAKYDVVFCGSTWCLERMKERGITNGRVLIQGVDFDVFKPMPVTRTDNEFRLFSGGKFEYRKGQDIVIAAFRELSKTHDNMRLVCAWYNPWPQLIQSMRQSPHLNWVNPIGLSQSEFFTRLMEANGIDPAKVTALGPLSQPDLAAVMNQTDLGVFPNRCEGGTNLVLMEYMACGKPVVVSYGTGHKDVVCPKSAALVGEFGQPDGGWSETSVSAVVSAVELAHMRDTEAASIAAAASNKIAQFTWERAARTILDTVVEFQ